MGKFGGCFFWLVLALCLIDVAENLNIRMLHSSMLKDHAESNISNQHDCANTWFVWKPKSKTCHCGHNFDGIVSCDESTKEVKVLDCYCVTYNSEHKEDVVGSCFFNCGNRSTIELVFTILFLVARMMSMVVYVAT